MKKTSLFALVALTLFTFISCENFLKGEDVKEEITKTIEYNNAPSYPINVELFNDSDGKIKTPATGEVSKKVTDEFTIRFEPAADHVFVKWEAIVKDLSKGEVPSDYIQFDDAESTETTVTFKKASNKVIIIRPVCPPRLSYTMYQTESGVLPRDSSVELTFNQEVATDLSSSAADYISITGDTIDVDEHFKSPEVKGKKLIFKADTTTDGYIPIENNNQRGITVRIPKEKIWYINKDYTEPVKVYLDADIKETYFINSETSSKTVFKYKLLQDKNEKDLGILKIDEKENDNEKQYAYSVGQQIALKYRIPEGYSFQKWNFYNKNELLDPNLLSLEFSEEEYTNDLVQVKITVTNYIPDTLTITPIIHETLKVTSFNLGDSYKTYERDSDIVLGFNKDLAPECIDNIIIQIPGLPEGKTVDDYFEPAVINGKTYTRKAKKIAAAKLIPLGLDGTNTITISMAASDVYYVETLSDGTTANVGFDADTVLSYKINAETINKIKIKFFVEDDYSTTGEYKIDGIVASGLVQDLTPGKSVKLRFKLTSDDYYFKGWRVTRSYNEAGVAKEDSYEQGSFNNDNLAEIGLSVAYDDNENEFGYEALTKIAQATITVDEYKEGTFAISPVIVPIPTAVVIIDGANGKFSPAKGTYRIKEKIFENLSFDPDGDYEFIRWQIYNETTGEEYNNADYITINDLKAERTSYAVVRVPEEKDSEGNDIKLAIRPVVTERPQILSYSPMFDAQGSTLRDTTIQVLFDYDMSEYSIYYTSNELASLRHTLNIDDDKDKSDDNKNELLKVNRNGVDCYYGYKTNGVTNLKNITIKNNRTGENLNAYYRDPVFETPRNLSLKVVSKQIMPPEYSQISVSIERGFFYEKENKSILMAGAKKWIYQVGLDGDNKGPELKLKDGHDEDITIVQYYKKSDASGDDVFEELESKDESDKPSITANGTGTGSLLYVAEKVSEEDDKKVNLKLDLNVVDNVAISSSFNIRYQQLYDANYSAVASPITKSFGVPYDVVLGVTGQYNKTLDLSFLDDGVYAMWFEFPDANGFTSIYPPAAENAEDDTVPEKKYYFAIDRAAPSVISDKVTVTDGGKSKYLELNWKYETPGICRDLKNYVIKYNIDNAVTYQSLSDSAETYEDTGNGTLRYVIPNPTGAAHYSIDLIFNDYAGNSVTYNLDESTIPSVPTSVTLPTNHDTGITINYTMPDTEFSGTRIRYKEKGTSRWLPEYTDNDGNTISAPIENITKNTSLTQSISDLNNAKQYEFEICSYDSISGKVSAPYYTTGTTLPLYVTKPSSISIYSTSFNSYTDKGNINYYTPVSAFGGIKVIYATQSDFSDAKTYSIPNSSNSYLGTNVYKSVTLSSSTSGTALVPGTDYYLKLRAWYNTEDNYVESGLRTTYTKTASVTGLTCSSRTSSSLTASWTKPAGNFGGYLIEYKPVSAADNQWESVFITGTSDTSYQISTYNGSALTGGTFYNFRIRAGKSENVRYGNILNNSSSGWQTNPNAVTNITAQKQSTSSIKLSWTNPTGTYTKNCVYIAESEAGLSSATAKDPSNTNYHIFDNLTPGKVYYFKVVTFANTLTNTSQILSCSTDIDPVSNPTVSVTSDTSIKISWTNPSASAFDGVRIYCGSTLVETITNKTSTYYVHTGLTPNTEYSYSVTTYKNVNGNEKTAAASAGKARTLSPIVTNVGATANSATQITVSWTNPSNNSYWKKIEIYNSSTKLGEVTDKTKTSFAATNLTPGTSYNIYVKTINNADVANSANYVYQATPLDIAKNLTLSSYTTNSATYTWTLPDGNYDYLYFYYKLNSASSWSNSGALSKTATSYTLSGLSTAKKYDVKVLTSKTNWNSKFTDVTSFYTKPNAATNFGISSRTDTSITLSWTKPTGDFGRYDVYYKKLGTSGYYSKYLTTDATSTTINTNLSAGECYEIYLSVSPTSDLESTHYSADTEIMKYYTNPNPVTNLTVSNYQGQTKLSWSKPAGSHNYYRVRYKKSSASSWTTKWVAGGATTSLTLSGLDAGTKYDFGIQTNCDGYGQNTYSAYCDTVQFITPPPAVSSASLYTDDGMGNIQVKYTFPSFDNYNMEVDFYVNGSYVTYTGRSSYVNGGTGYKLVTIPNFARGTTYTIGVRTYIYDNGWIAGPMTEFNVCNSTGNIYINGTSYGNTKFENVITSNTTISKKNTGGSFTSSNVITLTPYSMGAYEVTGALFKAVMGTSSTEGTTPVNQVSWYAAIAFCNKLSAIMGFDPCYTIGTISNSEWKTFDYSSIPTSNNDDWNKARCDFTKNGYHLPTDWQWEFAARGGSTTASDWSYDYSGGNTIGDVAWYNGNASSLHTGGLKTPNRLYLYDMTGNLWEWVTDWGNNVPAVTATDFTVYYDSSYRTSSNLILRGGAYSTTTAEWKYVKYRLVWGTGITKNYDIGIRLCRNKTY